MNTSRIHILTTFVLVVFLSHTTHAQTTQKVEDISFVKTPTVSTTTNPLEKIVRLNDTITVNITSRNDPTTPIDIFALLYTNDDTPIKRLHIKTVFNEEQGVQKKYSLKINQELMSQVANAASMRLGYCANGCRNNQAYMIKGKIIFKTSTQKTLPSTLLGIPQTF